MEKNVKKRKDNERDIEKKVVGVISDVVGKVVGGIVKVVGGTQDVAGKFEKPRSKNDKAKSQYDIKKMREDLNRKNDLEQNITLLIGGKTGMIMMWENLIEAAAAGEVSNFRFYGANFMRKAEPMEKFRSEIRCLTKEYKGQSKTIEKCKNPEAAELIRLLILPYKDRQICKELSDKNKCLKESGFLEASSVSEEALEEWGERVQKEFS